jgi:hypothetical protein
MARTRRERDQCRRQTKVFCCEVQRGREVFRDEADTEGSSTGHVGKVVEEYSRMGLNDKIFW